MHYYQSRTYPDPCPEPPLDDPYVSDGVAEEAEELAKIAAAEEKAAKEEERREAQRELRASLAMGAGRRELQRQLLALGWRREGPELYSRGLGSGIESYIEAVRREIREIDDWEEEQREVKE